MPSYIEAEDLNTTLPELSFVEKKKLHLKQCVRCKKLKPGDPAYFYRKGKGFKPYCIPCNKIINKEKQSRDLLVLYRSSLISTVEFYDWLKEKFPSRALNMLNHERNRFGLPPAKEFG